MRSPVISTGSLALDFAMGTGGWPLGHIVEIFGDESSAKTAMAMLAAREGQRIGEAVYVDADKTFDADAAARCGVSVDRLIRVRTDTGEQALDIASRLVITGSVSVVVVDSVAALLPASELRGEEDPGAHRRLVSKVFSELHELAAERGAVVVAVNRLVRSPNRAAPGSWLEATAGGDVLPARASIRLRLKALEVGVRTRVRATIEKNLPHAGAPGARTDVVLGDCGVARAADLLIAAYDAGVVSAAPGGFWFGETPLGPLDAAMVALRGPAGAAVRVALLSVAPWRRGLPPLPPEPGGA